MKRKLKIAGLALLALVALLVACLAWVIYTEAGLRFAVARLPAKFGKSQTELVITNVQGTIARGFSAERVDVRHEVTNVAVVNGRARVNFWPLLVGRIAVHEAYAERVEITVKKRVRPRPQTPPKFLPRLLSISATRASTDALVIEAPNGRIVQFDDVTAAGTLSHRTIRVFDSNLAFGVLRARALGQLHAADPMKLEGDATVRMIIEGQPEWRADAVFDGDLDRVPIEGKLQAPFRADFSGELLELSSNFNWTGEAQVHDFDLRDFGAGGALGIVSGTLKIGGEMNAFHAEGPLTVPGLGVGLFDVKFAGEYSDRVVIANNYEVRHRPTGSLATGKGTIEPVDGGPKLALAGTWRNVHWPLIERYTAEKPELFASSQGRYTLDGVWPYALTAAGDLQLPDLAPVSLDLRGALNKEFLGISSLAFSGFGGGAQLAGDVRWNPEESWTLAGHMHGLDPASFRPGFPGSLDFDLAARGAPFGADQTLDLTFRQLRGRLRGNAATGSGRIVIHRDDYTFDHLRFQAGRTHLAIHGHIGAERELDLEFNLDADNLALLAEGARGELNAQGRLAGTSKAPVIQFEAHGQDIEHQDLKIAKLSASVDLDWRGQRESKADVALSRLTLGQRELTEFNVKLDGTTTAHGIRTDVLVDDTTLHLSGKGGFADGVWRGTVGELFVDDSANLNLQLDTPFNVMVSADAFDIGGLCMHGQIARFCAEASGTPDGWTANAEAQHLPISTLTAGLTRNVEYQGTLNATASASRPRGSPIVGEARVDLADAALRHRLASGRIDVIKFGSGRFSLRAEPAEITAELRLDAGERALIAGRVNAERNVDDLMASPMRGTLQMATGELGFVTLYLPTIDRVAGRFDADLSFAGTLGEPRATGVLRLSDAEVDVYQLNLALRALEMEARIVSNDLMFETTAKAGNGTLASAGRLEWRDGLPYGEISVDGQNLRVVDVPEARIDASPDLDFRIAGREISVKGEVNIPKARIEPADLTNAVLPSADEIIVGMSETVERDPFRVTSEITMSLGDDVRVETYGLSGHITGSITERTLPGEPTRATGELQVRDGEYLALARKLDIERGRLFFTGGLLVDPAVDIRAVKVFPDLKAGVNVRGTLREPRLTFFSEPSYPQSQIVSLLLAGGGLESASGTGGAGNPGATQEVAGQAAALLAAQLGDRLGLPDISVESSGRVDSNSRRVSNDTSVVLGKYLSPRLYVSYGISLTEAINTIKMRYTLDDNWTIKTEAGKERAADLVFTIER